MKGRYSRWNIHHSTQRPSRGKFEFFAVPTFLPPGRLCGAAGSGPRTGGTLCDLIRPTGHTQRFTSPPRGHEGPPAGNACRTLRPPIPAPVRCSPRHTRQPSAAPTRSRGAEWWKQKSKTVRGAKSSAHQKSPRRAASLASRRYTCRAAAHPRPPLIQDFLFLSASFKFYNCGTPCKIYSHTGGSKQIHRKIRIYTRGVNINDLCERGRCWP